MPTGREDALVRSFDSQLNDITRLALAVGDAAVRDVAAGTDTRADESLTQWAVEAIEVALDNLLISALSVNVTVRRDILEAAEERRESR